MSSNKGFENKNELMSKIISLAVSRSNGRLNSAYLLESYLKVMVQEGYIVFDSSENEDNSSIKIYDVMKSILELEADKMPGFTLNGISSDPEDSDLDTFPSYMSSIMDELYSLSDETVINNFSQVLKEWELIDEPLKLLLKKLNTDIDFIDVLRKRSTKDIEKSNIAKDIKQLTLEDVYNIEITENNKEESKSREDIVLSYTEENNSNKDNRDTENVEYEYMKPEFLIDMVEELDESTEVIVDLDNYKDKMLNVICRKKQKSICLVGESGIGKTSIAKYFLKHLIENGLSTNKFDDLNIFRIDSTRLISDTSYRGEFEEKVTDMLDFFEDIQVDSDYRSHIILFLDDLANYCNLGITDKDTNSFISMILPYVSNGSISLVSTCSTSMYHKVVEQDNQLSNVIQVINMKEPSEEKCLEMLEYGKQEYESYHGVTITKAVLKEIIHLSNRYIKQGSLPGKAVKVIDQALAIASLADKNKLSSNDVLNVISDISEINIKDLTKSDKDKLKELNKTLHTTIISQNDAVDKVVKAVRRGKLGINSNEKPIASLLFVGPTGVGKTELTKQLHKCIFNSKESFLKLDMSEFSEEASISKLIGSAPGYVGYENGGRLTEYVKHNPSSLILFDEIEKANTKIYNSLLQILDEGRLTDNTGCTVDFKDCIIIMTSNAGYGADGLAKSSLGFSTNKELSDIDKKREIDKKVRTALETTFSPEFLNRLDSIVLFNKLTKEDAILISKLSLNKLKNRLKNQKIEIDFTESLINFIAEKGYSEKYGARNINREIQDYVEDAIAEFILDNKINKSKLNILDVKDNKIIINYKNITNNTVKRKTNNPSNSKEVSKRNAKSKTGSKLQPSKTKSEDLKTNIKADLKTDETSKTKEKALQNI